MFPAYSVSLADVLERLIREVGEFHPTADWQELERLGVFTVQIAGAKPALAVLSGADDGPASLILFSDDEALYTLFEKDFDDGDAEVLGVFFLDDEHTDDEARAFCHRNNLLRLDSGVYPYIIHRFRGGHSELPAADEILTLLATLIALRALLARHGDDVRNGRPCEITVDVPAGDLSVRTKVAYSGHQPPPLGSPA